MLVGVPELGFAESTLVRDDTDVRTLLELIALAVLAHRSAKLCEGITILRWSERLIANNQNDVLEEGRVQRRDLLGGERRTEIEPCGLGSNSCSERLNTQRRFTHRSCSMKLSPQRWRAAGSHAHQHRRRHGPRP